MQAIELRGPGAMRGPGLEGAKGLTIEVNLLPEAYRKARQRERWFRRGAAVGLSLLMVELLLSLLLYVRAGDERDLSSAIEQARASSQELSEETATQMKTNTLAKPASTKNFRTRRSAANFVRESVSSTMQSEAIAECGKIETASTIPWCTQGPVPRTLIRSKRNLSFISIPELWHSPWLQRAVM